MDPAVKAKWVAALRSGKYEQARHELRSKDGAFCCLGVLCKLFAEEGGTRFDSRALSDAADGQSGLYMQDANLPGLKVGIWAGLDPAWEVRIDGSTQPLYDHNDNGRTFAEIAAAIEEQL